MEGQDKSGFSIMWMLSAPAFGSSLLNVWKEALDGWVSRSGRSDPSEFTSYSCCTTSALLSSAALSFLLKIILCVCVCVYVCLCVFPLRATREKERKHSAETKETTYSCPVKLHRVTWAQQTNETKRRGVGTEQKFKR